MQTCTEDAAKYLVSLVPLSLSLPHPALLHLFNNMPPMPHLCYAPQDPEGRFKELMPSPQSRAELGSGMSSSSAQGEQSVTGCVFLVEVFATIVFKFEPEIARSNLCEKFAALKLQGLRFKAYKA